MEPPISAMSKSSRDLSQVVHVLKPLPQGIQKMTADLQDAIDRSRSTWWQRLGPSIVGAVLTAALILIGQYGLSVIAPPSDAKIWAKATAGERQALRDIAARPGR